MSHELFGERFVERAARTQAWHKLGQVFPGDERLSVSEAFRRARMDYGVLIVPQTVMFEAPDGAGGLEVVKQQTGKFMVMRRPTADDPEWRYFGETSARWECIDNMTLAAMFDPASKYYPLETAGALSEGKRVFFTLKSDPFGITVNGKPDELESYILVLDFKTPGSALTIAVVPVRVVCNNTLQMALRAARFTLPLAHTTGVTEIADFVAKSLAQIGSARKATVDAMQMLADHRMAIEDARAAFEVAYPTPQRPELLVFLDTIKAPEGMEAAQTVNTNDVAVELSAKFAENESVYAKAARKAESFEYTCKRAAFLRDTAELSLMNMADGEGLGINAYTILNAVSETEEHRAKQRGDVAKDLLFGTRGENMRRVSEHLCERAGIDALLAARN